MRRFANTGQQNAEHIFQDYDVQQLQSSPEDTVVQLCELSAFNMFSSILSKSISNGADLNNNSWKPHMQKEINGWK